MAQAPTVQKQRLNVYTMMLIISFIAICTAIVLLYMELNKYGAYPWWKTGDAIPKTSYLESSPVHPVRLVAVNPRLTNFG